MWSRREGDRILLRPHPGDTRILVDVHPNGREYLTTPHSGNLLQRHDLESGRVLARVAPPEPNAEGASWGLAAAYLGADRVIATVDGGEDGDVTYLLDRNSPGALGRIQYTGSENGWLAGADHDAWLTVDPGGVQQWGLSSSGRGLRSTAIR